MVPPIHLGAWSMALMLWLPFELLLLLVTTDVQTASVLFFETFVFINCTFGSGSLARGCVVTLELGEGEGEEREVFWLERESGSTVASQCNRTQNSRSVRPPVYIIHCSKCTHML